MMKWDEALTALSKLCIPFSLTYDHDYGIDKKSGWTFCIRGCVCSSFESSPERAVIAGLVAHIR